MIRGWVRVGAVGRSAAASACIRDAQLNAGAGAVPGRVGGCFCKNVKGAKMCDPFTISATLCGLAAAVYGVVTSGGDDDGD